MDFFWDTLVQTFEDGFSGIWRLLFHTPWKELKGTLGIMFEVGFFLFSLIGILWLWAVLSGDDRRYW
ncbi:hypothetical protein [Neobacillus sp. Marseille-QA0830]